MSTPTKRKKPLTPKPHAMAFVRESGPCENCACEWFRPTIRFPSLTDEDQSVAIEGEMCANLWCEAIRKLRADRLTLAKLAARTPMFFNPLDAFAAETLRDKLLTAAGLLEESR